MIPVVTLGMTYNRGINPAIVRVVPDGPDMTDRNPAFRPENITSSTRKMVDIELDRLGGFQVGAKKVHVVYEVVQAGNNGLVYIRETLSRKVSNQLVVAQCIRVRSGAADALTHRSSTN